MSTLQDQINQSANGSVVDLPYGGEYHEQIIIDKPITLRSTMSQASIVGPSPTVSIHSEGVIIENLNIDCNDESEICLSVTNGYRPKFNNVFVKGKIQGLDGEGGYFEIPDVIEWAIEPKKILKKKIIINCPAKSELYVNNLSGIKCNPCHLESGINEIQISTEKFSENILIAGELIIETASYKLKRKISLVGNTLNTHLKKAEETKECLWFCKSSKSNIKKDLLKLLPEGEQGLKYQYILDINALNCEGFDIRVDGLPAGLQYNQNKLIPGIEGKTDKFGKFDLTFIFKKDDITHSFLSRLIINEQKIIPLTIKPIKDNIEVLEDQVIDVKFEVDTSNSLNIKYGKVGNLPEGLHLNNTVGDLYGKISVHGNYNLKIKIEDGVNEIYQSIKVCVKPKNPLTVELEDIYKFIVKEKFNIPIIIYNSDKLFPKINIAGQQLSNVKLVSRKDKFFLLGKFSTAGKCDVSLNITDIYGRVFNKTITINCVNKPSFSINWTPESPIFIRGQKFDNFSTQVNAQVNEDRSLKIKFTCLGDLPPNIFLTEDGVITGKIDGNSHILKIRGEVDDWYDDKDFEIITNIDSTKIISRKGPLFSGIFQLDTHADQDISKKIEYKKQLKKGKINEYYEDQLIISNNNIIFPDINLQVLDLPDGLSYFNDNLLIKGVPKKEGTFNIKVNNVNDNSSLVLIEVVIEKSIFQSNNKSKNKIVKNPSPNVKLGNAFNKK